MKATLFAVLALVAGVLADWDVAMAHQTYITTTLGAASGSQLMSELYAQYGFKHHSPWYLYGEGGWSGLPSTTRDNSVRVLGELGYEGKYLGAGVRAGNLSFEAMDANMTQAGGYLFVRFLTLVQLWGEEKQLSKEDKEHIIKQRVRSREEEVALAPMLYGEYDEFNTATPLGATALRTNRIKIGLRWKFSPYFIVTPGYEGYTYAVAPGTDPSELALESRNNRTILSGPRGPFAHYLGVFGRVANVIQLHAYKAVSMREAFSVSLNAVSLANGRHYGAIWVSWHRRVDDQARWAVSPGFEIMRSGPDNYSFFSVSFSYIPNSPFLPEKSYEP